MTSKTTLTLSERDALVATCSSLPTKAYWQKKLDNLHAYGDPQIHMLASLAKRYPRNLAQMLEHEITARWSQCDYVMDKIRSMLACGDLANAETAFRAEPNPLYLEADYLKDRRDATNMAARHSRRAPQPATDTECDPPWGTLERALIGKIDHKESTRDRIYPVPNSPSANHVVHVKSLGRYFPVRLLESFDHFLTREIIKYKNGSALPESVISAITDFLLMEISRHPLSERVLITAIPDKNAKGRHIRLLKSIEKLTTTTDPRITIKVTDDIFEWIGSPVNQHTLRRSKRFASVAQHLRLRQPEKCVGYHVIVLDDIVTTGATFWWAKALLREATVLSGTFVALAMTVTDTEIE